MNDEALIKLLRAALAEVEARAAAASAGPVRNPKPQRNGVDWDEVERVALAAHERGDSMRLALAAHFGISPQAAQGRLSQARGYGRPIPDARHAPRRRTPLTITPSTGVWTPQDARNVIEGRAS